MPFLIFWLLMFFCRGEIGWRWTLAAIAVWVGLLLGCYHSGASSYIFVAVQSLLDCILILVIFKGDIRIR